MFRAANVTTFVDKLCREEEEPWIGVNSIADYFRVREYDEYGNYNSDWVNFENPHLRFQAMLTAANNFYQMNARVSKKIDRYKIHIVGDSKVGKSSIIEKYLENRFQDTLNEASKEKNWR